MIRIRTKVGEGRVFTLYFQGEWVTIMSGVGKTQSTESDTLMGAGINHLIYCEKLKEIANERGRLAAKLLHGEGHRGDDGPGVSDGNDGAHSKGTDGDDREGWDEVLPTDPFGSQDEESSQLETRNTELNQ
jgi:hypothetical protein